MSTPTESETPRTMHCFRDGTWHADELANLAGYLEGKLNAAQQRIAELEKDKARFAHLLTYDGQSWFYWRVLCGERIDRQAIDAAMPPTSKP